MMATSHLDGETSAADRIINQLLIEMDSIDAKENIFVITTSHQPDKIPSILLQPGTSLSFFLSNIFFLLSFRTFQPSYLCPAA
jgi:SpoVK/Ycf46/Vps4 family AAA+-type ATPase